MHRATRYLSIVGVTAVLVGSAGTALAYEAPPLDEDPGVTSNPFDPSVDCPGTGVEVPAGYFDLLPQAAGGSLGADPVRLVRNVVTVTAGSGGGGLGQVVGVIGSAVSEQALPTTIPCPLNAAKVTTVKAQLASTGVNAGTVIAIAGGLLLVGTGGVAAARRRAR